MVPATSANPVPRTAHADAHGHVKCPTRDVRRRTHHVRPAPVWRRPRQIPLQFDFLPPGARSVAMGSAFVGAADDATAAFTNPAGLARLSERSVSAELRFKQLTTPYLSAGRVSGSITGIGLDTIPMPVYGKDVDNHFGPTFGSLLWPFGANTSVIGYAHQVATIENAFSDQGVFFHFSAPGISDDRNRKNPVGGSRSVTITNYGGAVGYKFSDTFSVGGGVSFYRFRLDADFARCGITGNFAGPVYTPEVDATAVQRGTDWSPAFNLGVLWDPIKNVKIGGAFRLGPGFDFSQRDHDVGRDDRRRHRFRDRLRQEPRAGQGPGRVHRQRADSSRTSCAMAS